MTETTSRPARIAGYAALFDRVDRGGDVVRRGAFARELAKAGAVEPFFSAQTTPPMGGGGGSGKRGQRVCV
ncbi:MAG: HK97 family phage prohead protease, partial [Sphingomonadaceae bacterium]